ncbi:unnamed protein product [Caenorhabditis auriculariae]|uniref:C-type lectin domain-containing protein n=1 Tax=Caenorhabditis auriculariae TaxID=2777116 RepID=A0A8S1GVE3_9PELO|nr:unnamed protein product [Caenorhabditis auriculariae]
MLGAQALRTKQKVEQKEKEKRHRERLRSIELQRDRMHRAACEEAAAQFLEIAAQPPLKMSAKHRHSLHSSATPHLNVDVHRQMHNGSADRLDSHSGTGPQRSTSSDYCRAEKKNSISSTTRLLKWLGISDSEKKDLDKHGNKRRMSTFTFYDSYNFCISRQYGLVSVVNAFENNFISDNADRVLEMSNGDFWLGGMFFDGNLCWVDQEPFSYRNFAPGNGNATDKCVSMRAQDGRWDLTDCGVSLPFICRRPIGFTPTATAGTCGVFTTTSPAPSTSDSTKTSTSSYSTTYSN